MKRRILHCDPMVQMVCPDRQWCTDGRTYMEGSECDQMNRDFMAAKSMALCGQIIAEMRERLSREK